MRGRVFAAGRSLLWSLSFEKQRDVVLSRCTFSSYTSASNSTSEKKWASWSLGALCAGLGTFVWGASGKSECAIPIGENGATAPAVQVDGCDTFDHVILGGGTAGCVIAYLLAKWVDDQKINANVLLVDGGPGFEKANPDLLAWYDMWGEFGKVHESQYAGDGTNRTSVYPITPSDHRGLGGCGAHDTRIYYLPSEKEQHEYAKTFGWSLGELREYMQTAMNLEPAIKACPHGEDFFDLVIKELSERSGLKRLPDDRFYGNVVADSVAYFDVGGYALSNTRGIRWSPAMLVNSADDSIRPKSLKVLTGAEIEAIDFRKGDPTVVEGVRTKVDGEPKHIRLADKGSVTLCAGSIGNSAILQRSGVGDPQTLRQVGIEPVLPHPEVGHGVDHEEIAVQYAPPAKWPGGTMPAGGVMGWALGIFKSLPGLEQIMQAHFSIAGPPYDDEVTVVGTPNNTKPDQHKGYRVQIQSPSSDEAAVLKYEYSSHEREVFLKGLREMVGMFEKLKEAGLVGERVAPPRDIDLDDDNALWSWIHDNKHTAYHWLGTCKAGLRGKVTPGSVVDETFRLRTGTDQEKVVDNLFLSSAAVLPFPPTANPHVTIQSFAVAEAWQAFQHMAKIRGIHAQLPQELQTARSQLKSDKGQLRVRGPGEEKPNIGQVAKRYFDMHQQQ